MLNAKFLFLMLVVVVLGLVNGTCALDLHWDGEADNNLFVDGRNWDSPGDAGFDDTMPGPSDTAYIDSYAYNSLSIDCNVLIQTGDVVNVGSLNGPYYASVTGAYSSLAMTGGTLTINGDWQVAYDQVADTAALLDLSGS